MSAFDPDLAMGATPIAELDDLAPAERRFVVALRLWLESPAHQAEVWSGFARDFGAAQGRETLRAFERFLGAVADGVDRKLWRNRVGCPILGRDEAAMASVIALAARGQRAEAARAAAALVRADAAQAVLACAADLGRLLGVAPAAAPSAVRRGPRCGPAGFARCIEAGCDDEMRCPLLGLLRLL
jgi:hypothetical protein